MAMAVDAVVGKVLGELLKEVVEMKDRAVKFRPTLESLESTLKKVERLAKQIDGLNNLLDKPAEETKELIDQLEKGKKLVKECSNVQWWNCCHKADYQPELQALNDLIFKYFNLDMQGQIRRDVLENQVMLRELCVEYRNNIPGMTQISGVCSPPGPPSFTVGLDVPLSWLKSMALKDHDGGLVLTVTGPGGSGKSTLTKMFCWDQEVKGKFKENIFFIAFAKTPKFDTILQRLFQHNGFQMPELQNEDDKVNQLENLLRQIGKSPTLLVLDDVSSKSISLIHKFVFSIPNYTILVTSRVTISDFGHPPYALKPLGDVDARNLLCYFASPPNQSSSDDVEKIARWCRGSPLALIVTGRSLNCQSSEDWHDKAEELSTGHSIVASSEDVLTCLQKSFDDLDAKVAECFRDLSLFPEAQRIPVAALVDMWAELCDEDDGNAKKNIKELVIRNMADRDTSDTRNITSDTIDYNYRYVTQHGLLRDLAIFQTSQKPPEKRNRLIIDISGNNLPEWWTTRKKYHIAARTLSISTDEAFTSEWCNLQPTEVEVLVLNLREKKRSLPMFMKKMNKLKVLIITNYDLYHADLKNFELLDYLSNLKRIRLENVSIPFLSKTGMQLKNLRKFSFFMCNVNEAFKNSNIQVSNVLPNLEEMNIDYCDVVELPVGLFDIVSLKKFSITNCHKLSKLPEEIGNLVNLESLSLTSCTSLEVLPDSITSLHKLKYLDISHCLNLVNLPKNVREMRSLEKLNHRGCVRLRRECSPPEPPAFTVGLDVPMRELKLKLLNDHHGFSVLTVTGTGGSGKSTLAQKFCWDKDVKGKFKENIFFVTFAKTPKLKTIVQRLFQHNNYPVPEFQSDDDTVYQLEHLLKEIGKNPILLVLDDVLPESVSLVDKFVFHIPNYKILVTSRITIRRFGQPYVLKPLNEADAIDLFCHSASLNQSSSDIPDNIVKKIARGCSGSPLALIVSGKSLRLEPPVVWHNRTKQLSKGYSILDSSSSDDVLTCLQKSFEVLDAKVAECFRDLSLFPEAQRIPATALIDIWAELLDEDDDTAMENIHELVKRNMADIVVTRNTASSMVDYNYHYVTQHDLLRELAIHQTRKEPTEKRNRLIIDVRGNNLPKWWNTQNEYHIAARTLSISTDEEFTSEWCNLQPTEVEVLVMNLREKKRSLPMFMKKMNKLKVLIITNYDFHRADLENFELLDYLSELRRIRLEKVSIPFLSKTGVQLKNLQKFSFFMCNVNEALKNSTIKVSNVLPNLEEMNIDYCDMVELPVGLSDIVSLKKLSITNCHKLSALPEGIGKLVNLETLRLTSCTDLVELPDSITSLHKLKYLDISDCVSLGMLPENMGELRSLERLNFRGCTRLTELPYSITELEGLRVVVCDEETAALWEPFKTMLDVMLEVAKVDSN